MSRKPRLEYEDCDALDWVLYEFATIEYDYKIHPIAARNIEALFRRLWEEKEKS